MTGVDEHHMHGWNLTQLAQQLSLSSLSLLHACHS